MEKGHGTAFGRRIDRRRTVVRRETERYRDQVLIHDHGADSEGIFRPSAHGVDRQRIVDCRRSHGVRFCMPSAQSGGPSRTSHACAQGRQDRASLASLPPRGDFQTLRPRSARPLHIASGTATDGNRRLREVPGIEHLPRVVCTLNKYADHSPKAAARSTAGGQARPLHVRLRPGEVVAKLRLVGSVNCALGHKLLEPCLKGNWPKRHLQRQIASLSAPSPSSK